MRQAAPVRQQVGRGREVPAIHAVWGEVPRGAPSTQRPGTAAGRWGKRSPRGGEMSGLRWVPRGGAEGHTVLPRPLPGGRAAEEGSGLIVVELQWREEEQSAGGTAGTKSTHRVPPTTSVNTHLHGGKSTHIYVRYILDT
ncbi:hypothetical protein NDU88_007508 [Pleurodeles waltl]|uniref:Uncharacterized protein n=1 Tax=Pleurodeles waltl TaxID=8319 RepID=A0AAV7PPH8_PLEWA|nr:hypothetical protein NDU88_007508 [Pleurodeles waltl]